MKRLTLFLISIIYLFAQNALDNFKNFQGTLRIAGGTAHIPVMKEVSKEITTINPKIKIAIAGGGSGVGIKKVGENLVDIGNSGRKPTKQEINKYHLVLHKWAIDGIAVVVNKNNPVKNLTQKQIQAIFSAKITNWKTINGNDKKINIYTRDKASGTRKVFWKKILNKGNIAKNAIFVTSNGAMKRAIQNDPNGIGFISAGFINKSLKGVAINHIMPSKENIKSGKYPFSRGLYSLTKGKPKGLAKEFINYLFSKHVQRDIVANKGFIPVR